jgi:hypothetical protein
VIYTRTAGKVGDKQPQSTIFCGEQKRLRERKTGYEPVVCASTLFKNPARSSAQVVIPIGYFATGIVAQVTLKEFSRRLKPLPKKSNGEKP